jgi:single-strand DNA-binding protein
MNQEPLALDRRPDNRVDNIAVLRGTVTNAPQRRALPAGHDVAQFDVATRLVADARDITVSVPIAWYEPPATALGVITTGVDVLVIGTVRRRFFRVGGATQSRTEVVADAVVPTRRRKQVAAELQRAADRLLAG